PFRNPSEPTPGASNRFRFVPDVVINEILYRHAPDFVPGGAVANPEEWIELYNRGQAAVDLGGWRLAGPLRFSFPDRLVLAPGAYLVVARDAESLRRKHPGVPVIGDFTGRLAPGATLQLLDASDNPAAEVRFFADRPWPEAADGGGASLELRHPAADPAAPESWAASLEAAQSPWQHYEFDVVARKPRFGPNLQGYHELRLCLLGSGEALLDNVRVVERPATTARQLVPDPGFDRPAGSWRFLGNHRRSGVVTHGDGPVLHLVATGPGHYLLNHLETTFQSNGSVVPIEEGTPYRISFDAQWLSGSPRLRLEAYYNQFAAQAILARPATTGTPGRRNSTYTDRPGPTFRGLVHSPALPAPGQDIAVQVEAAAPEGIAGLTLRYRPDTGTWQSRPMILSNQAWRASIPGQPAGTLVQFHVTGEDTRGVVRHAPAGGEESRALVRVADAPALPGRQSFHLLMTAADTAWLTARSNILSDDRLGGTVVVNGEEVFYDCRVRLRGSMWSRRDPATTGFNVEFPGGQPFRGIHPDVTLKRPGHREFLLRQLLHQAGGVPDPYDDLVPLLTPVAANRGPGRLSLARYEDRWLESQFADGKDGPLYLFEGIREFIPDGGGPEDPKPTWPTGFVRAFDLADLGPDPEQYRWSLPLVNGRTRDDYGPLMAVARLFDREGPDLETNAPAVLDLDQWLRTMAAASLAGVADVYAQGPDGDGNPHNLAFYARPGDRRLLLLPQDWDAAFARGVQSQVYPNANLGKLVDRPAVRRAFQGHLLDLVERAFHPGYLAPWARHFSALSGEDMNPVLDYLRQRTDHCLSTLPPRVAFELTTHGGLDFSTNASQLVLEGVGWVDVAAVRLSGQVSSLPITWLDGVRWQAICPLAAGTNRLALVAYNRAGEPVGFDQLTVTNLRPAPTLRDALRLTELHYHPATPSPAEVAAGFTDADDFEFLELLNLGAEPLDLGGAAFVAGISYRFAPRLLPPGGRVVLAKSPAALAVRQGTLGTPVVGGYAGNLSNGGERLVLLDAAGQVVLDFAYDDSARWPAEADGGGASPEVRNLEGNYSDPANWSASRAIGGTPGEGPPAGPATLSVSPGPNEVRLSFLAAPGQAYLIEYQDQLAGESWQEWQAIPADWQERLVEADLDPGTAPTRFFRVRSADDP
ncbi:MAG: lamin tail domain-containing protein, partial [Verrucomicrobiota bacterium]